MCLDIVSTRKRSRLGLVSDTRGSRLGLVSDSLANVSVSSRSRELRSRSWSRSRPRRSWAHPCSQMPSNPSGEAPVHLNKNEDASNFIIRIQVETNIRELQLKHFSKLQQWSNTIFFPTIDACVENTYTQNAGRAQQDGRSCQDRRAEVRLSRSPQAKASLQVKNYFVVGF